MYLREDYWNEEAQLNSYISYETLEGFNLLIRQNQYSNLMDDMTIMRPMASENSQVTAYVIYGAAINKNSEQKNKAFKFVKFALSEEASVDPMDGISYGLPINNKAVEKQLDNITEGIFEPIIREPENYLVGVSKNNIDTIKEMIHDIDRCVIRDSYESSIFYPEYFDYLDEKISMETFISNLDSKTKLYLTE